MHVTEEVTVYELEVRNTFVQHPKKKPDRQRCDSEPDLREFSSFSETTARSSASGAPRHDDTRRLSPEAQEAKGKGDKNKGKGDKKKDKGKGDKNKKGMKSSSSSSSSSKKKKKKKNTVDDETEELDAKEADSLSPRRGLKLSQVKRRSGGAAYIEDYMFADDEEELTAIYGSAAKHLSPPQAASPSSASASSSPVQQHQQRIKELHDAGLCKPCLYFHKGRCRNSESCSFCHLCPNPHPGLKAQRQERKEQQKAQEAANAQTSGGIDQSHLKFSL